MNMGSEHQRADLGRAVDPQHKLEVTGPQDTKITLASSAKSVGSCFAFIGIAFAALLVGWGMDRLVYHAELLPHVLHVVLPAFAGLIAGVGGLWFVLKLEDKK